MLNDTENVAPNQNRALDFFYLKLGVLVLLKTMGGIAQEGQVQDPQALSSLLSACYAL